MSENNGGLGGKYGYPRATATKSAANRGDYRNKEKSALTPADTSNNEGSISVDKKSDYSSTSRADVVQGSYDLNVPSDNDSSDESDCSSDTDRGLIGQGSGKAGKASSRIPPKSPPVRTPHSLNVGEEGSTDDDDDDDGDVEVGFSDENPSDKVTECENVQDIPVQTAAVDRTSKKRSGSSNNKDAVEKKQKLSDGKQSAQRTFSTGISLGAEESITVLHHQITSLQQTLKIVLENVRHMDSRLEETHRLQLTMMEYVQDLNAVANFSRSDSKKTKEVRHVDAEVPFFNWVFSDDAIQVVMEACIVGHVVATSTSYDADHSSNTRTKGKLATFARGAALAIRVMMFTINLRKKENKSLYKTGTGQKASELREGIVLSALVAAQNNSFNAFRVSGDHKDDKSRAEELPVTTKAQKPRLPSWLKDGVVGRVHVTQARVKVEETNTKALEVKSTGPEKGGDEFNEIAHRAATELYRKVIQTMTAARNTAKIGFFDEVGYLFLNWASKKCLPDQSSLKVKWAASGKTRKYVDVADVPESVTKFTRDGEEDTSRNDKRNKALLRELMKDCPEMTLKVQHEVFIRQSGKKDGTKDFKVEPSDSLDTQSDSMRSSETGGDVSDKKEVINRDISLIDISCRFLSGYTSQTQHSSPASFLCSSKDSLRCIYTVALCFKSLLEKVMKAFDVTNIDELKLLDNTKVNGLNMRSLFPNPARINMGLTTKCVRMFQSVFNARNNTSGMENVVNLVETADVDGSGRKESSERLTKIVHVL